MLVVPVYKNDSFYIDVLVFINIKVFKAFWEPSLQFSISGFDEAFCWVSFFGGWRVGGRVGQGGVAGAGPGWLHDFLSNFWVFINRFLSCLSFVFLKDSRLLRVSGLEV